MLTCRKTGPWCINNHYYRVIDASHLQNKSQHEQTRVMVIKNDYKFAITPLIYLHNNPYTF